MGRMVFFFFLGVLLNPPKAASQLHLKAVPDSIGKRLTAGGLPQNFYSRHTGFFCRQEARVQKALALPVYFRLGSKSYVDYLERKPNARLGQ
jgi:hypothetical protein